MRMNYLRYHVVVCVLIGCVLSMSGCNNSETTNKSKSEKNVKKQKVFDIVGTWHAPPRDQKPLQGEWGPTRITMTFTNAGKVETIVNLVEETAGGHKFKSSGSYSIKGNVLSTEYIGDGGPANPIILSYRKKYLVMQMGNEEYIFERSK